MGGEIFGNHKFWPQATKIEKCILDRQLAPVLKVNFGPVPGWQITFTISGY